MNATADVKSLFEALPHMGPEDLRALQARTAFLLKTGPKNTRSNGHGNVLPSATSFAAVMYSALVDQMTERTGASYPPFAIFQKQVSSDKFNAACAVIEEANAMWFPKQTKSEQASMAAMYAGLVLDRLTERGSSLVWGTINYWLENLPALVNDAFPGYATAGMLSMVQALRTKKK